jgi:hypothetical protein
MSKESFIELYEKNITRQGSKELLEHLKQSDFFIAPASSKHHAAYEGGLCEHSVNVYTTLYTLNVAMKLEIDQETLTICGLLHDLCKINYYKVSTRNVKNEKTGAWEKVPFYMTEDQFPYGHGEKSVYLIQCYMRLKTEEAMAIRWHMGGYDKSFQGGEFAISGAYEKYPLCSALHSADLMSTYIMEKREK